MNLKELSFEKQVKYLTTFLQSDDTFLKAYLALSAFRHNLISRDNRDYSMKPVLRWYLGQLAKAYITKQFKQAQTNMEKMSAIGLVTAVGDKEKPNFVEYRLDDSVFPALQSALEKVFTKKFVDSVIAGAKFYRNPERRDFGGVKNKERRDYERRSGEGLEEQNR